MKTDNGNVVPREWLMDAICEGCGYDFGDLRESAGNAIEYTIECNTCGEFTKVEMQWR